jgi:hypothetical protein
MALNLLSPPAASLAEPLIPDEIVPGKQDWVMNRMARTAENADTKTFIAVYNQSDWFNRPPEDFVRATRLALSAGAHLTARALATQGSKKYPNYAELQKYARVLAAPKIIQRNLPADPALEADREWLVSHSNEYSDQWVALQHGELLGAVPSLQLLVEQIKETKGIFFTKVFFNYSPLPSPLQVGEGTVTSSTKIQFLPQPGGG